MTTGTEPTLSTNPIDRGELWSFLRSCLSQGGDIWLDHKEKSYEEYSIRLDAAARERVSKAMHLLGDEITQLRGNLSLAEEGLAAATQELGDRNVEFRETAHSYELECRRLVAEIEQHKRNLAWQSKETDAQVQEIQRQQQQVVDLKSDYLRRHNDAVDRFEALTDIQREIAGCGPDCSKDFLRLALNSVMQIATNVLNRPSSKPGVCAYIGAPDGKPEPCVRTAGHSGPHEHAKRTSE
jgi:hypothetical protein